MTRAVVSELNNKYKHCLITCKQLSNQDELVARNEMKGVPVTADKLIYLHAIELCLNAASLEFFGKAEEVSDREREKQLTKDYKSKTCICSVSDRILKLKSCFID